MRLKTVVKLGTVVSVLLFALAVGYYAFMRLDMTDHNRDFNLFSLIPSDCIGVLESDNVSAFLNECPNLNYSNELDDFQSSGLYSFLISEMNGHAVHEHGGNGEMGHLVVSFHEPGTSMDQVVYLCTEDADEHLLSDIMKNYMPGNFLPKEETYRGKQMLIYPLHHDRFMVAYIEKGFVVLSYQKRLIEEVIDAQLDDTALSDDTVFSEVLANKKNHHSLKLYGRSVPMPFLDAGTDCWSEYDFYMNSDVVYLMGGTYMAEDSTDGVVQMAERLTQVPVVKEEKLIISADKDSTALYMDEAYDANDTGVRTLFNECVANLSNEAAFSMVVDMKCIDEHPERFEAYLPPFVVKNAPMFRSFILSAQLSLNGEHPSHLWVFTYKD
jgi:hypothetical protein